MNRAVLDKAKETAAERISYQNVHKRVHDYFTSMLWRDLFSCCDEQALPEAEEELLSRSFGCSGASEYNMALKFMRDLMRLAVVLQWMVAILEIKAAHYQHFLVQTLLNVYRAEAFAKAYMEAKNNREREMVQTIAESRVMLCGASMDFSGEYPCLSGEPEKYGDAVLTRDSLKDQCLQCMSNIKGAFEGVREAMGRYGYEFEPVEVFLKEQEKEVVEIVTITLSQSSFPDFSTIEPDEEHFKATLKGFGF